MTYRTPSDAALELRCPFARTFAASPAVPTCQGPSCALWRWEEVTTAHPAWRAAVLAQAEATGEKVPHSKASRYVADHLEELGIRPTRGYCGAGGKP